MSDWTPPSQPPVPPAAPHPDPWGSATATAPPSAPPGWSASPTPSSGGAGRPPAGGTSGGGGRRWAIFGAALLLIALIAAGLGFVAAEVTDDETAAPAPSAQGEATTVSTREPDEAPLDGNAQEPVAEVAAAVSPAVVQLEVGEGLGSGVVYDADGLILTAAHVVEGADDVTVRFSDGTAAAGEVVGANAFTDVAVVSIDPPDDLPVAALGSSADLQPGQVVVALGSPFGLDQTVTSGIVGAVNRATPTTTGIVNMVQTDTAINPGNSGGPLVDIQGRVIGLNDQIFTQSGGSDGIGLAVPIDLAVRVADSLVAGEPVEFGFLGVAATDQAAATGAVGETGAVLAEVEPDSVAAEAGLAEGDRVLAIDDEPVGSFAELAGIVSNEAPGTTVTLLVERSGDQQEIEVTLDSVERE